MKQFLKNSGGRRRRRAADQSKTLSLLGYLKKNEFWDESFSKHRLSLPSSEKGGGIAADQSKNKKTHIGMITRLLGREERRVIKFTFFCKIVSKYGKQE